MIGTWENKQVIGNSPYRILEVMNLPEEVQDELSDKCPSNDSGKIINPKYCPKLKEWLTANGFDNTERFIGWWSW